MAAFRSHSRRASRETGGEYRMPLLEAFVRMVRQLLTRRTPISTSEGHVCLHCLTLRLDAGVLWLLAVIKAFTVQRIFELPPSLGKVHKGSPLRRRSSTVVAVRSCNPFLSAPCRVEHGFP